MPRSSSTLNMPQMSGVASVSALPFSQRRAVGIAGLRLQIERPPVRAGHDVERFDGLALAAFALALRDQDVLVDQRRRRRADAAKNAVVPNVVTSVPVFASIAARPGGRRRVDARAEPVGAGPVRGSAKRRCRRCHRRRRVRAARRHAAPASAPAASPPAPARRGAPPPPPRGAAAGSGAGANFQSCSPVTRVDRHRRRSAR